MCQNVFELGDHLLAGASPTHLDGILDAFAEVVPNVLVGWHLDPRVLVPLEPGLDADDMGYLVVHRPPGALGGPSEVFIGAGAAKVDHGRSGVGEGRDEVVQTLRRCRMHGHAATLLRVLT